MASQEVKQRLHVKTEIIRASLRFSAWLLVAMIVVFTLSPIELRPTSGASASLERIAAFAALGVVFALAYPNGRSVKIISLISFAAALETLQNFVPGRHGRSEDFIVKAVAAVAGLLLAQGIVRIFHASWLKPHLERTSPQHGRR
jgi:hypothetical protein